MDFATWMAFVAASLALLAIPGPTVLLVLAYALGEGRRIAVPTALGVAAGDLLAMSASLAGLGALVMASATAFVVVKWAGALYLLWLGIGMLRSAAPRAAPEIAFEPRRMGVWPAFRNAAAVTALNPKSIGFFLAFVPQFLDQGAPILGQSIVLIATFVALAAANALIYALVADRMRGLLARGAVLVWLKRMGGAALVAMGVAAAFVRRPAV